MCELISYIKDFSPLVTVFGTLATFYFAIDGFLFRKKTELEMQAKMITGWLNDSYDTETGMNGCLYSYCYINNGSNSLIYNVIARVVGMDNQEFFDKSEEVKFYVGIGILPMGQNKFRIEHPGHGMCKQFNIEITFTDSSNNHWIRFANGKLQKLNEEPLDYYGIGRPFIWKKKHLEI
ncbi:MAG: hypothetical protein L6Q33_00455 [Bacteriovoracaceae bacterium]|nr:hypothetical protein [Bacteriovoracaceae bacterium]